MSAAAGRLFKRVRYHVSMGPGNFLFGLRRRVLGYRLRIAQTQSGAFAGHGLEIGGPSPIFSATGAMPVYPIAHRIDNVTFDCQTRWEGRVEAGETFVFDPGKSAGRQYIAEAADLSFAADEFYDFVISSHMLEHCANPIAALRQWMRVVKTGGALLLVLPHRDGTFDCRRPVTPLSHLIDDDLSNTPESDRTHFEEILSLHDFVRDPAQFSRREFQIWVENNLKNRGAHHHVFDARSAARLIDHLHWQIVAVELMRPHHICLLACKPAAQAPAENAAFLEPQAAYLRASPFASDRVQARHASPQEQTAARVA